MADANAPQQSGQQAIEAAKAAAADAKKFAGDAKRGADAAAAAKRRLEDQIKALAEYRWLKIQGLISAAALFISVLTLGALFYQGYYIHTDSSRAETQLHLAAWTERFGILQKLTDDIFAIEKIVYDPNNVFAAVQLSHCDVLPKQADSDATKEQLHFIFSHYELYYDAAKLGLVPPARWRAVCLGAKDLLGKNCLLKNKWNQIYKNRATPAFRAAFVPACRLSK